MLFAPPCVRRTPLQASARRPYRPPYSPLPPLALYGKRGMPPLPRAAGCATLAATRERSARPVRTRDGRNGRAGGGMTHHPNPDEPEAALIARGQRGDRAAFNALVERYQATAYALALRMLGDPDAAADVTQDAF